MYDNIYARTKFKIYFNLILCLENDHEELIDPKICSFSYTFHATFYLLINYENNKD